MSDTLTAADVARWMVERLRVERLLYQETVVYEIAKRFGGAFTYVNDNGNLAIDRRVLSEFRKLTEPDIVWDRGERMWRLREPYDGPRRQVE